MTTCDQARLYNNIGTAWYSWQRDTRELYQLFKFLIALFICYYCSVTVEVH